MDLVMGSLNDKPLTYKPKHRLAQDIALYFCLLYLPVAIMHFVNLSGPGDQSRGPTTKHGSFRMLAHLAKPYDRPSFFLRNLDSECFVVLINVLLFALAPTLRIPRFCKGGEVYSAFGILKFITLIRLVVGLISGGSGGDTSNPSLSKDSATFPRMRLWMGTLSSRLICSMLTTFNFHHTTLSLVELAVCLLETFLAGSRREGSSLLAWRCYLLTTLTLYLVPALATSTRQLRSQWPLLQHRVAGQSVCSSEVADIAMEAFPPGASQPSDHPSSGTLNNTPSSSPRGSGSELKTWLGDLRTTLQSGGSSTDESRYDDAKNPLSEVFGYGWPLSSSKSSSSTNHVPDYGAAGMKIFRQTERLRRCVQYKAHGVMKTVTVKVLVYSEEFSSGAHLLQSAFCGLVDRWNRHQGRDSLLIPQCVACVEGCIQLLSTITEYPNTLSQTEAVDCFNHLAYVELDSLPANMDGDSLRHAIEERLAPQLAPNQDDTVNGPKGSYLYPVAVPIMFHHSRCPVAAHQVTLGFDNSHFVASLSHVRVVVIHQEGMVVQDIHDLPVVSGPQPGRANVSLQLPQDLKLGLLHIYVLHQPHSQHTPDSLSAHSPLANLVLLCAPPDAAVELSLLMESMVVDALQPTSCTEEDICRTYCQLRGPEDLAAAACQAYHRSFLPFALELMCPPGDMARLPQGLGLSVYVDLVLFMAQHKMTSCVNLLLNRLTRDGMQLAEGSSALDANSVLQAALEKLCDKEDRRGDSWGTDNADSNSSETSRATSENLVGLLGSDVIRDKLMAVAGAKFAMDGRAGAAQKVTWWSSAMALYSSILVSCTARIPKGFWRLVVLELLHMALQIASYSGHLYADGLPFRWLGYVVGCVLSSATPLVLVLHNRSPVCSQLTRLRELSLVLGMTSCSIAVLGPCIKGQLAPEAKQWLQMAGRCSFTLRMAEFLIDSLVVLRVETKAQLVLLALRGCTQLLYSTISSPDLVNNSYSDVGVAVHPGASCLLPQRSLGKTA